METPADKRPLRILLIEDDPDDYLLTRELLADIPGLTITVDWAKNVEEGLAALRTCEHDAFLLDYRLGKDTGLTLLREAFHLRCQAPIILLTGNDDRDVALRALEAGASDYLIKGEIDAASLERSIRYAMQQKGYAIELHRKVAERTAALEKANAALRENEKEIRALLEETEAARVSAEAAKSRAEAATRAKDDFLAALSHELRTPLNPALLLATSLAEDESLPEEVRADIEVVARGIALQAQLVDDLLDITRISGGKLRLNLHPIDAHEALRHAHNILRADCEGRQIALTFDLAAPNKTIKADAVRLQQIFWNVLKNAIKFTPVGGSVTVRTCNPTERPEVLEVQIIDTGIGISAEMQNRIFDAFIQEDNDQGHRFGGIGLGLAITQRLVQLQNGRISVNSAGRGCGATFRIEMPLETAVPPSGKSAGSASRAATVAVGRRILLVEDHDQTRATMLQILQRRGHFVEGVSTTAAAREKAANGDFDLVISDLGLPDGDGHRLMVDLDGYGLPGIALSGYGMEHDLARSRQSGFFAHLTKPVDIHALESAIAAAPRRSAAR